MSWCNNILIYLGRGCAYYDIQKLKKEIYKSIFDFLKKKDHKNHHMYKLDRVRFVDQGCGAICLVFSGRGGYPKIVPKINIPLDLDGSIKLEELDKIDEDFSLEVDIKDDYLEEISSILKDLDKIMFM